MISDTVSTRESGMQSLDTRLLCGPSFFFFARKGGERVLGIPIARPSGDGGTMRTEPGCHESPP